jgi:hypothetical protein
LGIEFTPVSEKGSMGERDRQEDQERGIENGTKTKPFSWSGKKDVFEYPAKVDGEREGYGKDQLEDDISLYFPLHFLDGSADDIRAKRFQDQPIAENDSDGELIAKKRYEEFPQQDDLCNDAAHPHDEQRGFEGVWSHESKSGLRTIFLESDRREGANLEIPVVATRSRTEDRAPPE